MNAKILFPYSLRIAVINIVPNNKIELKILYMMLSHAWTNINAINFVVVHLFQFIF